MVIDTHIRPALFGPICRDRDRFRKRCDEMNYHLMGPSDMDLLKKQYALADIQKIFMLPDDNSSKTGEPAISNDEIAQLAACDSDFFIGFAAADPVKCPTKREKFLCQRTMHLQWFQSFLTKELNCEK